jgi:putative glycosyltransferase (TIGR04372 family)
MLPPGFDNPDDGTLHWNMGKYAARPIHICANINTKSYGDFASGLFFANTVAEHFDHRIVTLIYKNDAPFKKHLVRLLPTNAVIELAENSALPSLELFNASTTVVEAGFKSWHKAGLNTPDLFITERMAMNPMLCTFDDLAYLTVPADMAQEGGEALVSRGLKPDRWFCTLHCREPGFGDKLSRNFRDCDPEVFYAATVHIIKKLGGQVVRMGHPGMTPFPAMEGLIDLSTEADASLMQIVAVNRCRFMVCGDSGPSAIADAMHVPLALTNSVSYWYNNDREVVRTVDLITPEGLVINQAALAATGMHKPHLVRALKEGYQVFQPGPEELIRLVDFIYETTSDTTGWRVPDAPKVRKRPNCLIWPADPKPRGKFLPTPENPA